jgi:hypothetical protein
MLSLLGHGHEHASPRWSASADDAVALLASCIGQGRLAEAADTPGGASCTKIVSALLVAFVLAFGGLAFAVGILRDLQHASRLSTFLRVPSTIRTGTDPHVLSLPAARVASHLPPSKRELLAAHLRGLRAMAPSPEAEQLALRLEESIPGICDWALEAPSRELAALQALLTQAGSVRDGAASRALRLPARVALLRNLLESRPGAPLSSSASRETLLRLLREISEHSALPHTRLPDEPEPAEGDALLRVPADALVVDASHELGLYANVSTGGHTSGAFSSTEEASEAAEEANVRDVAQVSVWLPVHIAGEFDLLERSVSVRYDPATLAAAAYADCAGASPDGGALSLVAVLPPDEVAKQATEVYEVTIETSDRQKAGTDAHVRICLTGDRGVSGDVPLHGRLGESPFRRGSLAVFRFARPGLGSLTSLRLSTDGAYANASWHVGTVEVRHLASGVCYAFDIHQWLVSTIGSLGASTSLPPSRSWTEEALGGEGVAAEFASRAHLVPPAPLIESSTPTGDKQSAHDPGATDDLGGVLGGSGGGDGYAADGDVAWGGGDGKGGGLGNSAPERRPPFNLNLAGMGMGGRDALGGAPVVEPSPRAILDGPHRSCASHRGAFAQEQQQPPRRPMMPPGMPPLPMPGSLGWNAARCGAGPFPEGGLGGMPLPQGLPPPIGALGACMGMGIPGAPNPYGAAGLVRQPQLPPLSVPMPGGFAGQAAFRGACGGAATPAAAPPPMPMPVPPMPTSDPMTSSSSLLPGTGNWAPGPTPEQLTRKHTPTVMCAYISAFIISC